MQTINVGLLGIGTVGSGTINVLVRNQEEIMRRTDCNIIIKRAAIKNINKIRQCDCTGIDVTTDPYAVINDPSIAIVIELIGGTDIARDLVLKAIMQGKSVVTANKALIALHGAEIFALAREHNVIVAYEAAVAGGIPIIKVLREGLAGNQMNWLAGIINGTANFILSEMTLKKREFSAVLREAQALGYAEADPTFDIAGIDIAHKLTILAAIAFGVPLQFNKVYIEGIEFITPNDIIYAEQLGYRIKQLGIARRHEQGVELRVHPTLVPIKSLLSHVNGVMNAVLIDANAVGKTLYYGAGAGSMPTASAIVADLVEVIRSLNLPAKQRVPQLAYIKDSVVSLPILPIENIYSAYYLRMMVKDQAGVLAAITSILAQENISIEAILQKEVPAENGSVPIVIMTHVVNEAAMNRALQKMANIDSMQGTIARIRIDQLGEG